MGAAKWMVMGGLIVCLCTKVHSHETDAFSSPTGRDFVDLGAEFNAWVHATLERAVERANVEIRRKRDAGDAQAGPLAPDAADRLVEIVFEEFPNAYDTIEGLEKRLHSRAFVDAFPGQIVASKSALGGIYQTAHFPLDPRRVFKIWFASTFKMYGVHCGTDKIGHFIDMGHNYYLAYAKAKRNGADELAARRAAIRLGTDHPLYSEAGILGYVSAGAYSNADLVSNYVGLLFYINLSEPVKLKGVERPPMVNRDGPYWKLAPHVRPNSGFFEWFVSDHFDEALNPSHFGPSMRGGMRNAISDRADNLLWRYRDPRGGRRPAIYFKVLADTLKAYYGEDYGHVGNDAELITLTDACFEPVSERASPQHPNKTGHTALHWAVEMGETRTIERLLARGYPVDAPMHTTGDLTGMEAGNTPLHLAARMGRPDLIEMLLAAGASPRATNRARVTPLHLAPTAESAARLLAAGADANARDQSGRSPLHWAAADPRNSAIDTLIRGGADPNAKDLSGRTPLHLAAEHATDAMVAALLNAGAAVNTRDSQGVTPLHNATQVAVSAVRVRAMLARGAEIDVRDAFGYTPLHLAAREGDPASVAALLEYGADPKSVDAFGVTPLHLAARRASRTAVDLLLEAGADPAASSAMRATPLHEAVAAADVPTVARLREAGAPLDARDAGGRTPHALAQQRNDPAIVDALAGRHPRLRPAYRLPLSSSRLIR